MSWARACWRSWASSAVTAVIHAAGALADSPVTALTAGLPLSPFILFSSVTGLEVRDLLDHHLAAVLGHGSPAAINSDHDLWLIGMDSLSSLELTHRLATATGLRLPSSSNAACIPARCASMIP
jgi:Phosphopantetheine attachment site